MLKAIAAFTFSLIATAAFAAGCDNPTFSPSPSYGISVQSTAPAVSDVTGIMPGMNPTQVIEINKGVYGPDVEIQTHRLCFIVRGSGVEAKSPEFIHELTFVKKHDTNIDAVAVFTFSGLASGNQLVGFDRHVYFKKENAPLLAHTAASLEKKHGHATTRDTVIVPQSRLVFSNGHVDVSVPRGTNTSLDNYLYDISSLPQYADRSNPTSYTSTCCCFRSAMTRNC